MTANFQVPFIYWNKNCPSLPHVITAATFRHGVFATGAETGEVCLWTSAWTPRILCTLPTDPECRSLAVLHSPSSLLLSSHSWVLSIHADLSLIHI